MVFQDIDPLRFPTEAAEVNVPNVPFEPLSLPDARRQVAFRQRKGRRPSISDVLPDVLDTIPLGGIGTKITKFIPPALVTGGAIIAEAAELDTWLFNLLKGAVQDVAGFAIDKGVDIAKGAIEAVLPGQQFGGEAHVEPGISDLTPGGGNIVPHAGQQVGIAGLQGGAPLPSMGTIARVWDTWPGAGVTGGGRAPIFFRTVDGRTFVRKLDGTIKKIPKSRNIVINTRKIDLNQYIRAERRLEGISKRIAKRVRSLKRA